MGLDRLLVDPVLVIGFRIGRFGFSNGILPKIEVVVLKLNVIEAKFLFLKACNGY